MPMHDLPGAILGSKDHRSPQSVWGYVLTFADLGLQVLYLLGPTLAAFIVTGATEGRAGIRCLLRRYVLWRVGLRWYLVVLLGPP
jgi:hypothetical protein